MNSKINIKSKLKSGESTIAIASADDIDLSLIETEQIEYVKQIKKQAIAQRITLRQSIRDNFPKSLATAIDIMKMDFNDLHCTGFEMKRTEHIGFLKVQLDAAKAVMSLASHVLGEDILTLWAEKEEVKKSHKKIVYQAEILNDGSAKLTAKNETDIIQQAGIDKLEIDIEDVL